MAYKYIILKASPTTTTDPKKAMDTLKKFGPHAVVKTTDTLNNGVLWVLGSNGKFISGKGETTDTDRAMIVNTVISFNVERNFEIGIRKPCGRTETLSYEEFRMYDEDEKPLSATIFMDGEIVAVVDESGTADLLNRSGLDGSILSAYTKLIGYAEQLIEVVPVLLSSNGDQAVPASRDTIDEAIDESGTAFVRRGVKVYVFTPSKVRGMYNVTDGGATWLACQDIVMDRMKRGLR